MAETKEHIIPPITDPLGKGWQQPDRFEIEIDHQYARMKRPAFERLLDYSNSMPTGVYEGKMWKSGEWKTGYKSGRTVRFATQWHLHWWSASDDPDKCKGNTREIIIHEP